MAGLLANRLKQPGESPWVVVAATARSIPPRPDLAGWRPAVRKASSTAVGMVTTTAMSRRQEAAGMATAMGMVAVTETVDLAAGRMDLAPTPISRGGTSGRRAGKRMAQRVTVATRDAQRAGDFAAMARSGADGRSGALRPSAAEASAHEAALPKTPVTAATSGRRAAWRYWWR